MQRQTNVLLWMKGLKEYIKKHGQHFTIELAYAIAGRKYSSDEVENYLQEKVYYNVVGHTIGDITYIFNILDSYYNKRERRKYVITSLGNYAQHGILFPDFISVTEHYRPDFDFTPYI